MWVVCAVSRNEVSRMRVMKRWTGAGCRRGIRGGGGVGTRREGVLLVVGGSRRLIVWVGRMKDRCGPGVLAD